jgi:hypothetical protein
MAERSWVQTPTEEIIFRHHSFGSKPGAKIEWQLTWHCCICCNPAKGRVDFKDGWLIKSSFTANDEMKLVS